MKKKTTKRVNFPRWSNEFSSTVRSHRLVGMQGGSVWRCFRPFSFNKLLGNCDRFLFHNCTSWLKGRYNKFVPPFDVHFNQLRAPIVFFSPTIAKHFFSVIAGVSNLSEKIKKIFSFTKKSRRKKFKGSFRRSHDMRSYNLISSLLFFFLSASVPEDKRDFSFHHRALICLSVTFSFRLASSFR